jgi:hypothetical protein
LRRWLFHANSGKSARANGGADPEISQPLI